jgi:hypothetical protein
MRAGGTDRCGPGAQTDAGRGDGLMRVGGDRGVVLMRVGRRISQTSVLTGTTKQSHVGLLLRTRVCVGEVAWRVVF